MTENKKTYLEMLLAAVPAEDIELNIVRKDQNRWDSLTEIDSHGFTDFNLYETLATNAEKFFKQNIKIKIDIITEGIA